MGKKTYKTLEKKEYVNEYIFLCLLMILYFFIFPTFCSLSPLTLAYHFKQVNFLIGSIRSIFTSVECGERRNKSQNKWNKRLLNKGRYIWCIEITQEVMLVRGGFMSFLEICIVEAALLLLIH